MPPANSGKSLDAAEIKTLSRWIEEGAVLVNGQVVRPSRLLRLNDKIEVCPPAAGPQGGWIAEALPLPICFGGDDVPGIDFVGGPARCQCDRAGDVRAVHEWEVRGAPPRGHSPAGARARP